MENYHGAFLDRFTDTETLHTSGRKVAAIHFGGISVECLLKSIILAYIPRGATPEWKTKSNDPGHTLTNPGHSFVEALKRNNRLYKRAQSSRAVMQWINDVESPGQHFIDLRYSCEALDDVDYKQWFQSYKRLIQWLQRQATKL